MTKKPPKNSSTLVISETSKVHEQNFWYQLESATPELRSELSRRALLLEEYGFTPITYYSSGTMGWPTIVALYRGTQYEMELDTIDRHHLRVMTRDSQFQDNIANRRAFFI